MSENDKNPLDGALDQVQVEDAARAAVGGIVDGFMAARAAESIIPTDVIPHERQTFSLGYVSSWLGVPPPMLRGLMEKHGVRFAGSHNDVPYYDGAGLLAIARALRVEHEEHARA